MSDEKRPYGVGYKKPPKEHQFKKGAPSGNPQGRKKKSRNFAILLNKALQESVTVVKNGLKKKMTAQEAITLALIANAIKGNGKALERILKILPPKSEEEAKIDREKLIASLFNLDALDIKEAELFLTMVRKMIKNTAKVPVQYID